MLDRIIHIAIFRLISRISVFVCYTPAQLFYLPVKDSHDLIDSNIKLHKILHTIIFMLITFFPFRYSYLIQ